MNQNVTDQAWKGAALGAAVLSATVMRKLLTVGWEAVVHAEPPKNPADPSTDLREALVWSAATGAAVGVARMAARRAAAGAWTAATGELPRDLQPAA